MPRAEHYYRQGEVHRAQGLPGQDYAISGNTGDLHYVIVADGCSAADRADIGARILALGAEKIVRKNLLFKEENPQVIGNSIVARLHTVISDLGFSLSDMCSTLSILVSNGKMVRFISYGDGVLFFRDKQKNFHSYEWLWDNGFPPYLAYRMQPETLKAFIRQMQTKNHHCIIRQGGEKTKLPITVEEGLDGIDLSFSVDNLDWIAIGSDGLSVMNGISLEKVGTMMMHHQEGIPFSHYAENCLSHLERQKVTTTDDIAIGALFF